MNKVAEKEAKGLSEDLLSSLVHIKKLLEKYGPFNVGMPYIRPLGNKLWEMRLHSKEGIARSIYVLEFEKRIIILHTFVKKTEKTPLLALQKAKNRMKEIKK